MEGVREGGRKILVYLQNREGKGGNKNKYLMILP